MSNNRTPIRNPLRANPNPIVRENNPNVPVRPPQAELQPGMPPNINPLVVPGSAYVPVNNQPPGTSPDVKHTNEDGVWPPGADADRRLMDPKANETNERERIERERIEAKQAELDRLEKEKIDNTKQAELEHQRMIAMASKAASSTPPTTGVDVNDSKKNEPKK